MFFLISIVAIAQIILAVFIISLIIKCDKKVNMLAKTLEKSKIKLIWRLRILEDITSGLIVITPHIKKKVIKSLLKLLKIELSEATIYSLILLIKPKYKKIVLLIKLLSGITKKIKRRLA